MEKINKVRQFFKNLQIDGYIVPKNDEFFSEYVSQNKDDLKYISNFSGSFGLALILKKKNYLFVDGRYTQQAKIQSGKFFKIITIPQKFPSDILRNKKIRIGFDPKLHTKKLLKIFFYKSNFKLLPVEQNLIKKIKIKSNQNKINKFFILPERAVGKNYKLKIKKLVSELIKKKIDLQFITASENIAWLLNVRGQDSEFSPIPNSYLVVNSNNEIHFFCNLKKINSSFKNKLKKIKFLDIKYIDFFLSRIKDKKVLIDSSSCSFYFENILRKNNKINSFIDPIYSLKSIKSKIEIQNTSKAHIDDGAALTKFLFWVKKNYKKKNITEISAQKKLLQFRKKIKNFKFLSFPTISGTGPNGAIIHYKASNKTNRKLNEGDIYLVDSGGQYRFGTTDVTRTISLNNHNLRIKKIFTRVLKGHIAVANYKLKKNSCGELIDREARKYLKQINLDYAHGTGHGVGYFLNVHEGPIGISKKNKLNFKEGMIISNEPGYYETGKFGIRIENLVYVKKNKNNYLFKNLTMAPIDKSLIFKNLLKKNELNWLNNYHKTVYLNLKKFMNKSELSDLKQACSNI
jgi:Xaa-Pro aminopeptidase